MMNLQVSDWLSIAALIVSILSLVMSLYVTFLDRVKIRAFSNLYPPREHNPQAWIEVKAINHGRRTAILTMFGGDFKGGGWQGTHLGEKGLGLRLAENEFYKIDLTPDEVFFAGPENDQEYEELWFEDSQGRRHRVKHARKHLGQMKKT